MMPCDDKTDSCAAEQAEGKAADWANAECMCVTLDRQRLAALLDAELGERIREAGLRSVLVRDEIVDHRPGSATGEKHRATRYYQTRNRIVFSRRWAPPGLAPRLYRWAFSVRRLLGGGSGALGVLDAYSGRLRRWDDF